MDKVIEAEYQVIEERTPELIRTEIKTIEAQVYKTTLDGVIQIGARLKELKEMIGHGNWLEWCQENLGYSDRQARRYIEISEEYGNENSAFSNWTTSSNLSISKAYSLLSLPENEVQSFAEQHDVEDMTVRELKQEIREWKEKQEAAEGELEQAKREKETLQAELKKAEAQQKELEAELANADPKKVESLQKKLDQKAEEVKKAKAALKEEQKNRQGEIEKEQIKKDAEAEQAERVKEAEEYRRAAESRVADLEKKLEQSASEDILLFKVKTDQIQKDFAALEDSIAAVTEKEPEQAEKMKAALKAVMESLTDRII